jgi:hypothetical protein
MERANHAQLMLATADLDSTTAEPKLLSRDCPFLPGSEADQFHYYNCGFLFIDLEGWRREKIEELAFQSVKGYETQLKAWDQTLLNFVLRGRIGRLPGFWSQSCAIDGIPGEANIHYISMRKPWNHWSPMPLYSAWYLFHRLFVSPHIPMCLSVRAVVAGASRHLRDRLLVAIPFLKRRYLASLQNRKGAKYSEAYQQHLHRLRSALANPLWRGRQPVRKLKEKWCRLKG